MPKSATEIGRILSTAQTAMRNEFSRLSVLDRKIKGRLTRTWMPSNADGEYRDLFNKASSPWLEFVRDAIAQGVVVDGCNNDLVWAQWQKNGMDGRQNGVTGEAVGLGKSFILVLPGSTVDTVTDEEGVTTTTEVPSNDGTALMRPLSTLTTYAYFADPWDEYPEWVLCRVGQIKVGAFWDCKWLFIDDEALYRWTGVTDSPANSTFRIFEHGLGVTPVARVANTLPANGEPESSVERAIPIAQRIVDATFTLEMAQRYASFPQKWMTGGSVAAKADGTPAVNVSADSLLHNTDPEGKFGSFTAGSLQDVASAKDSHIKDLAAVCQVPPHYLLGAVVNMSAEGITAAESGYSRNISQRQDSMSEGYELSLRLVGKIVDLDQNAIDQIEVHFEDVSSRSLSQVSDAILKLSTLKLPLDRLFAMIPGFTALDATTAAEQAAITQKATADKELQIAEAATPPVPKEKLEVAPDTAVEPPTS